MLEKLNHYVVRVSIFVIILALIAGMAGCDGYTPSQNLEIRTWYDLDAVRNNLRGQHTLMNNLNYTTPGYEELASPTANGGKGWQPIGDYDSPFARSLDGQGYEIQNLFINRPGESDVGLLGHVGQYGVIKNIGVTNATVLGQSHVGGLAGFNEGTATNSYFSGSLTGNQQVGGLMGANNEGTVTNCHSSGNVTGESWVGGLVGGVIGIVSDSYSSSSVTGNDLVGGLLGMFEGTVTNSYSTGNVTGNLCVGGLVGAMGFDASGTVSNSYSTGGVTGESYVGGLVGTSYKSRVRNSYSTSSVAGNLSVGGLVGINEGGGTVTDSYSIGNVTGVDNVGGLVGENQIDGDVSNSYSTGSVTGESYVGGLVGLNEEGTVSDSFWDTQTSGQSTSDGGIGKNTTEMQDIATFSDAGWNIIGVALNQTNPAYIWNIVNGVTYPFLSWQP